jgi:hypothetical protein
LLRINKVNKMLRKIKLLKSNNIILLSLLITGLSYSQDQHSINLTTDNMIFQMVDFMVV